MASPSLEGLKAAGLMVAFVAPIMVGTLIADAVNGQPEQAPPTQTTKSPR